jgi:hypothetical protein
VRARLISSVRVRTYVIPHRAKSSKNAPTKVRPLLLRVRRKISYHREVNGRDNKCDGGRARAHAQRFPLSRRRCR